MTQPPNKCPQMCGSMGIPREANRLKQWSREAQQLFWLLTSLSQTIPGSGNTSRPKTHYRGQPLTPGAKPEARTEAGVRPHNEVLFLLNLLGYEILHLGR